MAKKKYSEKKCNMHAALGIRLREFPFPPFQFLFSLHPSSQGLASEPSPIKVGSIETRFAQTPAELGLIARSHANRLCKYGLNYGSYIYRHRP